MHNAPNAKCCATGRLSRFLSVVLLLTLIGAARAHTSLATNLEEYEGRQIIGIELTFEGSPHDPAAEAEFLSLINIAPNTEFSAVRVRDSLQALFDSGRVANARVEVSEASSNKTGPIRLRFVVHRQVQIGEVRIEFAA